MRYYQKSPKKPQLRIAIPLWAIAGLIWAIFAVRRRQHLLNAPAAGALFVMTALTLNQTRIFKPYWEIRKDRVVRRGLLHPCLWKTFLFSEIEYIGPITRGAARFLKHFDDYIEIRNTARKRMWVSTEDPPKFLTDIRGYLARITHDL